MLTDRNFAEAYEDMLRNKWIYISKISIGVAITAVLAGSSLDRFVYDAHFYHFFLLRLLCGISLVAAFGLYSTNFGSRYPRIVTISWLILIQIMISYMIYATEGAMSPYYAGLNLAVLGLGMVMPATLVDVIFLGSVTLAIYSIACFAHGSSNLHYSILYKNVYFLVATMVIAGMSVSINDKARQKEFRLAFELERRNKELAELDKLKSQFLANISHELRTPLTLIIAPLEDLLQSSEPLPDRFSSAVGTARSNALRLLKLVNDLLDVIRLEEGKAELERQPIDVINLVGDAVDSVSYLAEARGVTLDKDLPRDSCNVIGDEKALEKIFFNLLSNALKFTPREGVIRVSATGLEDQLAIEVQDSGIGIEQKDLPYVFDRFKQVDGSMTRRYAGTGLGLALVKELTEAHKGDVRITSQPGVGTTITVRLPVTKEAARRKHSLNTVDEDDPLARIYRAAEQVATVPLEGPELDIPEPDGRAPLVVVVDDEPDMRRYLVETLSQDYRVLQASDGQEGLDLVRSCRPDVAVLDLMLPRMDGTSVCRHIKQDQLTRATKVIVLTARIDENIKLEVLNEGAEDFLNKPFSGIEVRTRIRNLVQTAALEQDLRSRNQELEQTLTDLRRTESQLIQSEKLNALGSLAAGLLHEINNPLNYAVTALQMAKADPLLAENEDLKEMLADTDEGMQRIRAIVGDLRAFAYPSANEQATFVLAEAVRSALQFTAHELRGVRVEQQVPDEVQVFGSRGHIVQVLVNLFTNAGKSLHKVQADRDFLLSVMAEATADGRRMRVTVRDTGIGMSSETLERIFDPFFTTRDVGEGMGLGLSICHTIIKNHGGELAARSELGQWAEFTFDLPLAGVS